LSPFLVHFFSKFDQSRRLSSIKDLRAGLFPPVKIPSFLCLPPFLLISTVSFQSPPPPNKMVPPQSLFFFVQLERNRLSVLSSFPFQWFSSSRIVWTFPRRPPPFLPNPVRQPRRSDLPFSVSCWCSFPFFTSITRAFFLSSPLFFIYEGKALCSSSPISFLSPLVFFFLYLFFFLEYRFSSLNLFIQLNRRHEVFFPILPPPFVLTLLPLKGSPTPTLRVLPVA